jgi:hypothetical protein
MRDRLVPDHILSILFARLRLSSDRWIDNKYNTVTIENIRRKTPGVSNPWSDSEIRADTWKFGGYVREESGSITLRGLYSIILVLFQSCVAVL